MRQEYNNKILKALQEVINAFPDWRFQQILQNIDIVDGSDQFFEESKTTYNNLKNSKIYKNISNH